jgi:hypothetical protein
MRQTIGLPMFQPVTLSQGGLPSGSMGLSLTSSTYAALQTSSNSTVNSNSDISSGISALLSHLNEFPDMMTEDDRRKRLERFQLYFLCGLVLLILILLSPLLLPLATST